MHFQLLVHQGREISLQPFVLHHPLPLTPIIFRAIFSQHILKCYQNHENDKVMKKVMANNVDTVYKMYEDAVQQEKEWAEFLFKDGSMIGLSIPLLNNYIEYIANKRLRMIGFNPIYDISSTNNPLPWTKHWFNSRGLQNAPQETEIESYVIGGIKQDVTDDTFTDFKL